MRNQQSQTSPIPAAIALTATALRDRPSGVESSSSSSTELGAGGSVESDCQLIDGEPIVGWMLGVEDELSNDLAVGRSGTLGASSLRPLEGESAELRERVMRVCRWQRWLTGAGHPSSWT